MSGQTFEVFTLFPDAVAGFLRGGLVGKAVARELVSVHCTDYREFATDRYRTVDDAPYGGGPGMVMKIEPVVAALEHVTALRGPMHRILLTPAGPRFDQRVAERLAALPRIGLLCGRYEGIDDRVREHFVDECLSLGDFVLNGGEVAALAIIEAVARLREGVLGNPESAARDSFSLQDMSSGTGPEDHEAWLEHPHFTRPPEFRGLGVPEVLLAGDHADVARWRREQVWRRTWALRPDLRPQRTLPAEAPLYLVAHFEQGPTDMSERAAWITALAAAARQGGAELRVVAPGHRAPEVAGVPRAAQYRSLKDLARELRRRHGRAPRLVALGPAGDLPLARGAAPLLDLLAASGAGDLSAPLVLVLPCAATGDLARPVANAPQGRSAPSFEPLKGLEAAFSPAPPNASGLASGLAETPSMNDSSGPQPVDAAARLVAVALAELKSRRSTNPPELRHEQQ
ncbi:tRNA (guanine-N1)-methyltransferase [Nannocystis exedens]|uniref:tRNA (guanine-N(1)-)-methyltransferase n=1 Tax=Nannocystis exedens TaxID=54 RepID=A0A1I1UQC1_9BACT|nr:tRNA (guanosine(37)-N1)-methyltransferase TrmD [Nannocystis exedens]PCC71704.1 tRNA (guanine(37)-N(1))-methyltransferase [Nannocystis exedens]SFD70180.1 tRNA (guanine-N1)-methyltransferase [Nannocystis exedens]